MKDAVKIKGLVPASILMLVLVGFVLGWHTWSQQQMRSDSYLARVKLATTYASREIAGIIAARRHGVALFAAEKAADIANYAGDPVSTLRHRNILVSLRRHLPDAQEFTVADDRGKTLVRRMDELIDQVCQADIVSFLQHGSHYKPFIHPHPGAYHYDVMSLWRHRDRKGVFFVSFSPRSIAHVLKSHERSGFRLALTLHDKPGELQVDSHGTYETRPSERLLSDSARAQLVSRTPIPQTRWDLVAIQIPAVLRAPLRADVIRSVQVFALFAALGFAMLLYIRTSSLRRDAAERAVNKSEQRFHTLFDNAPDMLFLLNADGSIENANRLATQQLGYSGEELRGRQFATLADPADAERVSGHLAASNLHDDAVDYRMVNKDGTTRWVQQRTRPEGSADGQDCLTQVICRDIGDHKLMEATLQTLHQLSSGESGRFTERVYRLLHAGTRLFGLELAILSRIENQSYIVVATVSPDPALHAGAVLELADTYCQDTLKSERIVAHPDATDYPGKGHPAYAQTRFRAYLGIPIRLDGRVYGTLNFSSAEPRSEPFSDTQLNMLKLMAQWITSELRRQKDEQALAASEQRFRDFAASAADWFWELDEEQVITHVSGNLGLLAEPGTRPLEGQQIEDVLSLICEPEHADALLQLLRSGSSFGEFRLHCKIRGQAHVVELSGRPRFGADGLVVGFRGTGRDVTETQRQADRVAFAASHDALTGLFNRREFEQRLAQALHQAREEGVASALCYMDLDRFKLVNDQAGHMAGDALLENIAKVLSDPVRRNDVLARLGGDEFALLLPGCPLAEAERIAKVLTEAVASYEFHWQEQTFHVGVSIGIVALDAGTQGLDDALGEADRACYAAKQAGRGQVFVSR